MSHFDYFVVCAEMRTGSNFLEANLNAIDGLTCLGEAFNPHFIAYPDAADCLGVTLQEREGSPKALIDRVKDAPGLAGFRYFHDHDPRVFDLSILDPRCAKIVLTRNPVDSYVSLKIAGATGQWKLTNMKHHKDNAIAFDADDFSEHVRGLQGFQLRLLKALQTTGQTAFYLDYEDLQDVEVMNGLAQWLGVDGRLEKLDKSLKKQNPKELSEKVSNFPQMQAELARFDRFDLGRTPNFEPRRGAAIPTFVAAREAPLLYMPIKSGPESVVRDWLSTCGSGLREAFKQGDLRSWMREHPGHRAFTVLRHPVARAYTAYVERIENRGEGNFPKIRDALETRYGVSVSAPDDEDGLHREGFLGFLKFLKGNLSGQSSIRVDAAWASQYEVVAGFARFRTPDVLIRENSLPDGLAALAREVDIPAPSMPDSDPRLERLSAIYSADIETAARQAYARDYEAFGFGDYAAP